MELLNQMSSTQVLFPAAAVAVVLVCAALVFIFGFQSAKQPQFDKLPLVVDDRKSSNKKRKTKEKKSSPNRTSGEDAKTKESSKKSPAKEKGDKLKEEKPKPKKEEKPIEPKPIKKEKEVEAKKGKKKGGAGNDADKPADFDEGVWEEVPKKSDKKKVKSEDGPAKKDKGSPKTPSPTKKATKKNKPKDADVEAGGGGSGVEEQAEEIIKVVSVKGPAVDEDAARALQKQVEELQRVLKERERQDQAALGGGGDDTEPEEVPEVKDLRANKKMENKEKQKKKANEAATKLAKSESVEKDSDSDKAEDKPSVPVFDELGDTWTDAKVPKKSKKKVRKDQ